ncbi:uncharacterized protein HaLaN_10527 [Haematococcus lacustris]|uniref:Uncharacterized protein n=1 Tax=Haematococcus lacustris TaxID=44745 RepID=A0A699Z5A9_HAELA|nr:uncharacterized protein HaLaN_10527 [Haematococcus lacustris]
MPADLFSATPYTITAGTSRRRCEQDRVGMASSVRRGKPRKRTITVTEYEYDASMEAAYHKSLVRAVSRTLEEGRFPFVIMDAPNMKLSECQEVLGAAQRWRYEALLLQPLETDPVLCARRNVHGRTLPQLQALAQQWEAPPPLYKVLDVRSLFQATVTGSSQIDEVDMDNEDNDEAIGTASEALPSATSTGCTTATKEGQDDSVSALPTSRWADTSPAPDPTPSQASGRWGSTGAGGVEAAGDGSSRAAGREGGRGASQRQARRERSSSPSDSSASPEHPFTSAEPGRAHPGAAAGNGRKRVRAGAADGAVGKRGGSGVADSPLGLSDADILAGLNDALAVAPGASSAPHDPSLPSGSAAAAKAGSGRVVAGGAGGSLGPGAELAAGCKELAGVEGLEGLSGPELQELLARARARVRRRVWWPDQGQAGGQGVGHGGALPCQPHATKLLEEVHWVEGLGPAPGDTAMQYMDASSPFMALPSRKRSFADQVKAEHSTEHLALVPLAEELGGVHQPCMLASQWWCERRHVVGWSLVELDVPGWRSYTK